MAILKLKYCDFIKPKTRKPAELLARLTDTCDWLFHCLTWSNIQRAGPYVKRIMTFLIAHKNRLYMLGLRTSM